MTSDPRGVYLTGDAVRILYDLGIGDDLEYVGHAAESVQLHRSTFSAPSFLTLRAGATNALQQAVPEGLLQMQPRLEKVLRKKIQASPHCQLVTGATVTTRVSEEPPRIEYRDTSDVTHQVEGQWLVGADGKAGVVRKQFLEPSGIKQEPGLHFYDGTSIAANLHLTVPTPASHPDFALWALGYTPQQVYDLFWPKGWHFCCPPGKPTAGGRFGPHAERLWRHEFRSDNDDVADDAVEPMFWEHILPMVTLQQDRHRGVAFDKAVQYPRDCIQLLRCRPYHCTHRVVNRWFDKRTVLIGDAAHVFPPFAGQGIASGFRDAHQLAWRLALLADRFPAQQPMPSWAQALLESWARERRQSVDTTAYLSISLGRMSSSPPNMVNRLGYGLKTSMDLSVRMSNAIDPLVKVERQGMTQVRGGCFVKKHHGGVRLAQIYVAQGSTGQVVLSDSLFSGPAAMTLLVIGDGRDGGNRLAQATRAVEQASLPPGVLNKAPVVLYNTRAPNGVAEAPKAAQPLEVYTAQEFDETTPEYKRCGGYDAKAFVKRLGGKAAFVIVRADFFVFACTANEKELAKCLALLAEEVGKGAVE